MVDARDFRASLSRFVTGVAVVTTLDQGEPHGITVSALMPVSFDPPLLAISIARKARSHRILSSGSGFGVSILREGQEAVSDHFAGRPSRIAEPFEYMEGFPYVKDALALVSCEQVESLDGGDHAIYVGKAVAARIHEGTPLLHGRGRYFGLDSLGD